MANDNLKAHDAPQQVFPMCRLLAYLGPPRRLWPLLCEHDHSLFAQSYKPREMVSGTVNVDGFGVALYLPDESPEPVRYASPAPLWADENFASLGRVLASRSVLAAVRGATPGMPFGRENTQPFVRGRYAFLHNGYVQDFRRGLMRTLRAELSDEHYAGIAGGTDSEHLFALFLERLGARAGVDAMADALAATARKVAGWARERGLAAQLNMVVGDGAELCAVRYGTTERLPTLYYGEEAGGLFVVSEPLDARADAWRAVAPGGLLRVERGGRVSEGAL
jgi:ergothioneine biosynthesis protein EgtC